MENLKGIVLMVAAMAGFAIEDMFVKAASALLPIGQIILILGVAGTAVFSLLTLRGGHRLLSRDLFHWPVMLRNLSELVATMCFVSAIVLTPLASASAILQATPLAVTLGAALFLKAQVGWRRWSAIVVGFLGVLLVIRPGMEGFQPASLLAVIAVFALAARDLATRVMPKTISNMQLSAYGFASVIPVGVAMLLLGDGPAPMPPMVLLQMGCASVAGILGYYAITAAMRVGEIAVVTPYRYARLLFALLIGAVVFNEQPDAWMITGAALIIGSGLYTLAREARLRRKRV